MHAVDIEAAVRQASPDRAPARRVLERGPAPDPQEWENLAAIGLPGLGLPEDLGGAGFGIAEQAAAAQALGYVCTTIPFAAISLAARILARSVLPEARELAQRLAGGRCIVGAVLPAEGDAASALSLESGSDGHRRL